MQLHAVTQEKLQPPPPPYHRVIIYREETRGILGHALASDGKLGHVIS